MQEMKEPRLRKIPGGGHGNTLQYSCLENFVGRGAWWATVQGAAKSWKKKKTQKKGVCLGKGEQSCPVTLLTVGLSFSVC